VRLFVALWPPEHVVAELAESLAGVRALQPHLRWTRPEQWHLTLVFLDEVAEERLPQLTNRLARAARRHPELSLRFAGGGRFGDRVLWTRVDGDRATLRQLTAAAAAAARRSGLAVEDRPYRPHLTLARNSSGADLRPLVTALAPYRGTAWTADRLHLVRSRLGKGPGRTSQYDTVAAWPLKGPPPATG
jgi:2'-5' RNA ligase